MKKFNLAVLTLALMVLCSTAVKATNIGVIDFKKVGTSYNYAKTAFREIDARSMELQQFIIDKDKQYKAIDSPIAKKNFEEKTQKEFAAKKEALENMQAAKEDEIYNRIIAATKAVANTKKLDAVFDDNAVFVGGMDISDDVIRYLNSQTSSSSGSLPPAR